jgi:ribosomal protein S18 acetylase RimI-like enzyme
MTVAPITIRAAASEEIPAIASAMAQIDPWLTLGISAAEQEAAIRRDPLRRILAAVRGGALAGACTFRTSLAAEPLLRLKAAPLLRAHYGAPAARPADALPSGAPYPEAHPPAGYIHTLAVFAGFQGGGAGSLLLAAAEAQAAADSAREMFLFVSDFNPRARAFYERNGYRFIGAVPDCIRPGMGEHLMVKNL